jgi:hypothetical protein
MGYQVSWRGGGKSLKILISITFAARSVVLV